MIMSCCARQGVIRCIRRESCVPSQAGRYGRRTTAMDPAVYSMETKLVLSAVTSA